VSIRAGIGGERAVVSRDSPVVLGRDDSPAGRDGEQESERTYPPIAQGHEGVGQQMTKSGDMQGSQPPACSHDAIAGVGGFSAQARECYNRS